MIRKVGDISRKQYTSFNTTNEISDNAKLFDVIEDFNDKGYMFKYNKEWITKDDCKHFLADDVNGISVDLYYDVQANPKKQSPKNSKSVSDEDKQREFDFGSGTIKSSRQIKSSPNFKEFTADDIFDTFDVSQLTGTVFMDREECKNAKCGMEEFTDLMWDVVPTWLGVRNPDDVREVCRRAKNPKAKAFLEAFETALENARFTDKFYDSVKVHKKGNVQSSLGPRNEKKAKELIDEYNSLSVGDSLYTSTHLGRYLDSYFREHGLSYGDDFMCPPYREGEIVKMSNKVVSSRQIKSANSQEEFENLVIDIENRLGVNVEHSNIFNLPAELTYEDECYIDDICREQNCRFVPVNGSRRQYRLVQSSRRNNMIKSAYTREDYDRFDEVGNFIPYQPTEEELAKKDEIKKVLEQELSAAYEPDPMDDYVGYDSTNERIDMACERVAKQFGVDTDFVDQIAGEIDRENIARANAESEYVYQHCKDKHRFWDWYNGEDVSLEELGIDKEQMDREVDEIVHKYVNSSRQIKSSNEDSKLYTVEEFVDLISADYYDKEDFIDWVKEGIHGHDRLSADRWMEQWRERESMFISSEDSTNEDEFTVYTDDKEITVRKEDDNKWHGSDGKTFMGYLKPQDVLHWYRQDYGKAWIDSSRQIKSSTVTSDKQFRLIDTEHNDPKDGEDFTAEELRDYISKNDEYFDDVGLDYTIVDLNTGEEMNISTFRLNSSCQVKSALDTVKVTFDNGDTIVTDYNADVGREEIAKYYMHNYFNVGNEDEMHQVVKVEFPGNINSARVPEKADLDMAYQLEGYIESDHVMYDQLIVPVIKNLERKVKRGIFDYDKSLILWQHVADEGAKRYVKELGGPSYNVATRKQVAKNLAEYYKENYDVNGDIYNPIN